MQVPGYSAGTPALSLSLSGSVAKLGQSQSRLPVKSSLGYKAQRYDPSVCHGYIWIGLDIVLNERAHI